MKKAVLLLSILCCFILSSCKEEENNPVVITCSCENPLKDLPWLKTMVNGFVQDSIAGINHHVRIYKCIYQTNKTGFLIEPCVDCPDAGLDLRDCKGNHLCTMWGFTGSNCPEYKVNFDDAVIIYEQNKPIE